MTSKEHIIFFSILSGIVIIVLVLLYIDEYVGSNSGDKPLVEHVTHSLNDETRKEKNLMISDITAIIIAFTALIGTPITILYGIPTYLEKMRKIRINKLKDRMVVLFSEGWNSQKVHTPETLKKFFDALGPKFQKKRYKTLHQAAFDELGSEGRNPIWSDWDLKRRMSEENTMQEMRNIMHGSGGIRYR